MTNEDIDDIRSESDKFAREFEYSKQVRDQYFAHKVSYETEVAMLQLFTDPENQPTQYGTVTTEYHDKEMARERRECAEHYLSLHRDATKYKDAEIAALKTQLDALTSAYSGIAALQARPTVLTHQQSFDAGREMAFNDAAYSIGMDKADGVCSVVVFRMVPNKPTVMVATQILEV